MVRIVLIALVMAWQMQANAQDGYKIVGVMEDVSDGKLTLTAETKTIGETEIKDGKFVFTGKVEGVVHAAIWTADKEQVASLMLENKNYKIKDGGEISGGGEAQVIYDQFNDLNLTLARERQALEEEYRQADAEGDINATKQIDARFQVFLTEMQVKELQLLMKYSDTYVAAYIVASTMLDIDYAKLDERYNLLGSNAKATFWGKAIAEQLERYKQLEVGGMAPDFKLPSNDVGVVTLYGTKADLKIVNFWASWSPQCRQENVNLLRIYQQYRPKGVAIISISLDDNKAEWQKAIGIDGMIWENASDLKGQNSEIMLQYALKGIPYTYVMDENNVILAKGLRGEALYKKIGELLGK